MCSTLSCLDIVTYGTNDARIIKVCAGTLNTFKCRPTSFWLYKFKNVFKELLIKMCSDDIESYINHDF